MFSVNLVNKPFKSQIWDLHSHLNAPHKFIFFVKLLETNGCLEGTAGN